MYLFEIAVISPEATNEVGITAVEVEALVSQCVHGIKGVNIHYLQALGDQAIFGGLPGVYETHGKYIADQSL
jgi:hypothetical protein